MVVCITLSCCSVFLCWGVMYPHFMVLCIPVSWWSVYPYYGTMYICIMVICVSVSWCYVSLFHGALYTSGMMCCTSVSLGSVSPSHWRPCIGCSKIGWYRIICCRMGRWYRMSRVNNKKKSRIRETKNLSTDADSRTDTILESLRDLSPKKIEVGLFLSQKINDFFFFLGGGRGRSIRGWDLIRWPEGQWEASTKSYIKRGQTGRRQTSWLYERFGLRDDSMKMVNFLTDHLGSKNMNWVCVHFYRSVFLSTIW